MAPKSKDFHYQTSVHFALRTCQHVSNPSMTKQLKLKLLLYYVCYKGFPILSKFPRFVWKTNRTSSPFFLLPVPIFLVAQLFIICFFLDWFTAPKKLYVWRAVFVSLSSLGGASYDDLTLHHSIRYSWDFSFKVLLCIIVS